MQRFIIKDISEPVDTYQRTTEHSLKVFPLSALNPDIRGHYYSFPIEMFLQLDIELVYLYGGEAIPLNHNIVEIHDISSEGDVCVAWIHRQGRDGGGGNMQQKVIGIVSLPLELRDALVERVRSQAQERQLRSSVENLLQEMQLDPASVTRRRQEAFIRVQLDDLTISNRRLAYLIENGLDDATIESKRREIEENLRHQAQSPE